MDIDKKIKADKKKTFNLDSYSQIDNPKSNKIFMDRLAKIYNDEWDSEKSHQLLNKFSGPLADELKKTVNAVAAAYNPEISQMVLDDVNKKLRDLAQELSEGKSDFKTLVKAEMWITIQPTVQRIVEHIKHLTQGLDNFEDLKPYLKEELKNPEYGNKTINDLWEAAVYENDTSISSTLWEKAVNNAIEAKEKKKSIPKVTVKRAEIIEYPLDKINSKIWSLLEKQTSNKIAFATEKRGSKKELNIYYSIDFDELSEDISITKKLLPFDKRVYIAISALFNAGNKIITLTQIYYAMGNVGRPSKTSLTKINNSISKMMSARIYVNNEQEAATYKYSAFVYDGALLPIERGTAVVNGQLADSAIHIFREPPVISFAKQRKQVTTLDIKLLQSPISKTDANLLIDDYLIERITKAKNGKGQHKILYKTLYEKAGIKTKKQRDRAPDKVRRYLDHYKSCDMIKNYEMKPDGIIVYFK